MENKIGKRFESLIEALQTNKNAFARSIGKSHTMAGLIIEGKSRPSYDVLEAVLDHYPQISPEWLMRGEGEMFRIAPPKQAVAAEPADGYLQEYMTRLEGQFRSVLAEKQSIIEDMKSVIQYQRQLLESKREQSFHKPAIGPASSPWSFKRFSAQNA